MSFEIVLFCSHYKNIFYHCGLTSNVPVSYISLYTVYHSQSRDISVSNHTDHKDVFYYCGLTVDVSGDVIFL